MHCVFAWFTLCCVLLRDDVIKLNIFRVTGPLCGELTGPRWFPSQRPVTRSFDVFFDLRLNKRLSKQSWGWWLETPSSSLWRHCDGLETCPFRPDSAVLLWCWEYCDVNKTNPLRIYAIKKSKQITTKLCTNEWDILSMSPVNVAFTFVIP